jgi:hypothetical protein
MITAHVLVDTMENWDQEQLEKVVLSKHGNPRTTTDVGYIRVVSKPSLNLGHLDRVQILHRGYRDEQVCIITHVHC